MFATSADSPLRSFEQYMYRFYMVFVTNNQDRSGLSIVSTAATVFGAIHVIAWNAYFASEVEKLLWRISATMTTGLPLIITAIFLSPNKINVAYLDAIMPALMIVSIVVYVICRLYLIVEPFAGLRCLPIGAFHTVQWINYVPHIF
jgi:hypothetical protein